MASIILIVAFFLVLTILMLALLSSIIEPPDIIESYSSFYSSSAELATALQEVCRGVLHPKNLAFLVANAPTEVASSFVGQQCRLARLSLKIAGDTLVQRLRNETRARSVFLLALCRLERVSLGVQQVLDSGRRSHLLMSAKILTSVGALLAGSDLDSVSFSADLSVRRIRADTDGPTTKEEVIGLPIVDELRSALTGALPNDLARMIYLATLRDNNTGHYYHPELSRRFSAGIADLAMHACHKDVYEKIFPLTLEDLTEQIDIYMTSTRAPRARLIESWKKLQAYRATLPIDSDPICAEIFFMKVDVAVAVLEARLPFSVRELE
jgi:hypothetical protein